MLNITEAAADVLHRAVEAASRFDPLARVRIHRGPQGIQTAFAHEPDENDAIVEHEGLVLFVEKGLEGTLSTGAHDTLILQ